MTPLFFGPPARRLFGIHHPPQRSGNKAILICTPFGQESIRAHRFFRVLCERLSRAGSAVLRFDMYGSGDSGGSEIEGELDGWSRDVALAHHELQRLSPGREITWLGARLGGTVATLAAATARSTLVRLITWDPVLDGRSYLDELRIAHVKALERSFFEPDAQWRRSLQRDPSAFGDEALGTAISSGLRAQLLKLKPMEVAYPVIDTAVIATTQSILTHQWATGGGRLGLPIRDLAFDHPLNWTLTPDGTNPVVPNEAIQRMLAEING